MHMHYKNDMGLKFSKYIPVYHRMLDFKKIVFWPEMCLLFA